MLCTEITKAHDLGIWQCEATLDLPAITVTRLKADKSEFKYEIRRAFSEIVEELVEKYFDED